MKMKAILSTMNLQIKLSYARPMFRYCLLVSPIINTILLYEMFSNTGKADFASYVILGSGLMGLWSSICFSSAGDINRDRMNGTLSHIFTTPTDFGLIILGKVLGNTLISLVSIVISIIVAKVLFNLTLMVSRPLILVISLLALIICFITISILIAYLLTISRKTQLYMNCIEIPIMLLCGFVFPIDVLPRWILPLSSLLSPTWAIKLLRMSVAETLNYQLYFRTLLILFIINTVYIFIAHLFGKIIERNVRINATLEVS